LSDDEARQSLLANIEGEVLTEPRVIRFRAGRRLRHWVKNCVAIGLSSGFIEPLESTSIHLIQRGIIRMMQMFPQAGIAQPDIDEFNQQSKLECEQIRDFIVLHYHLTERVDTPFWRHCRGMEIPPTLAHRMRLFRETGRVFRVANELFAENSWIQVMLGQGIQPAQYHPVAGVMSDEELRAFLANIKSRVERTVAQLPGHRTYLGQYCDADANKA
ncbi:MAG: tryptophan 7-halogenase, partial [Gammaproteobacteria bacterium]|nr:tryptophan 7-halogenase [Gammaproteobacteria bacterium]